jgi:hypothetical protein
METSRIRRDPKSLACLTVNSYMEADCTTRSFSRKFTEGFHVYLSDKLFLKAWSLLASRILVGHLLYACRSLRGTHEEGTITFGESEHESKGARSWQQVTVTVTGQSILFLPTIATQRAAMAMQLSKEMRVWRTLVSHSRHSNANKRAQDCRINQRPQ